MKVDIIKAHKWQLKYRYHNFKPKLIFKNLKSIDEALFALGFFLMAMSSEILFNQPFKKKINILHNSVFKNLFKKRYERIERIETNSFIFSLFIILNKLLKEQDTLESHAEELILYASLHWANTVKINQKNFGYKIKCFLELWNKNKNVILSKKDDVVVDLIIDLYKTFEVGISNKIIIKKNIAVLIFSVSKAVKDFRYDVLNEYNKNF